MTLSRKSKREYVVSALDKFERPLKRYAARMLGGNLDMAADVVQYALMKLCEQDQTKSDRQLQAWLYAVCRNRIFDEYRKNGRQITTDPAHFEMSLGNAVDPQSQVEQREWLQSLKKKIDALPEHDREIIDLWSHGLKHREIAEVVGKKAVTIRVQIHRVIQVLKKEFGATTAACHLQTATRTSTKPMGRMNHE